MTTTPRRRWAFALAVIAGVGAAGCSTRETPSSHAESDVEVTLVPIAATTVAAAGSATAVTAPIEEAIPSGSEPPLSASVASSRPGPRGIVVIGTAPTTSGSVPNAAAVVAGMAAGFRRCYNRGLRDDASMKGTLRITANIGPSGEVQTARPTGGGGLNGTVTSCCAGVVSSRTFAPPPGGSAVIVIPISFMPE